jgi:hypothetical protein
MPLPGIYGNNNARNIIDRREPKYIKTGCMRFLNQKYIKNNDLCILKLYHLGLVWMLSYSLQSMWVGVDWDEI